MRQPGAIECSPDESRKPGKRHRWQLNQRPSLHCLPNPLIHVRYPHRLLADSGLNCRSVVSHDLDDGVLDDLRIDVAGASLAVNLSFCEEVRVKPEGNARRHVDLANDGFFGRNETNKQRVDDVELGVGRLGCSPVWQELGVVENVEE